MHYVPSGRKLNKNSLQLQNHIAVLLRTPTKLFQICKMTEGRLHGQIVYRAEQLASIEEIEKGWNVLILIEKDPSIPLQLTRDVKENTTTLGYLFSSTAKQSIEN
jgi:hypothetical protein